MWAFKNILSDNIVSKKSYTQNQLVFFGNTELDERGEKAFEIVSKINELTVNNSKTPISRDLKHHFAILKLQ